MQETGLTRLRIMRPAFSFYFLQEIQSSATFTKQKKLVQGKEAKMALPKKKPHLETPGTFQSSDVGGGSLSAVKETEIVCERN